MRITEAKAWERRSFASAAAARADRQLRRYLRIKRMIDVAVSAAGLVLCSPLFLLIALLIKLEDPKGPVFFSQQRIGKDGKPFSMYKFRSMVSNAEELLAQLLPHNEISGHMFKMKNDPRITKVGRFIRRTSLDELPQLYNVLRGDMSLVGPRPPLPREVEAYSPRHWQRLSVIPGCTGLWQVSGRNSVGFEEMVRLDLEYIAARSIRMDLKIIMKTFLVVFGAKDAY